MLEMDMTADEAMVRGLQSEGSQPSSPRWALASLLALLGVALASEYLFPSSDDRSATSAPAHRSAGRAAEARGRGRRATTPSEIPARGWKDILLRV
jgi:membrane protein